MPDKTTPCLLDKVNRPFRVPAPNMLWVSDFIYVAIWKGSLANSGFVLDALEQAVHERRPTKSRGLVHHTDRGSRYLSIR